MPTRGFALQQHFQQTRAPSKTQLITMVYCSILFKADHLNMIYMDLYGFIMIYIILLFLFLGFICLCKSSIDHLIGGGPVTTPAAETSTQGHCRQRNAFVRFRKDHVGKCVFMRVLWLHLLSLSMFHPPPDKIARILHTASR